MPEVLPTGRGAFSLRSLAGDAGLAIGGALFANAFNYVFHFVLSRRLGPDQYGSLATLLAAIAIVGVVGSSIAIVGMQESAKLWATGGEQRVGAFVRHVGVAALGVGAVFGCLLFAASFAFGPYLHIVSTPLWAIFAATLTVGVYNAFLRGVSQGVRRFGLFATSFVAETIVKLLVAVVLVAIGWQVLGAMGGILAGGLVGMLIIGLPLSRGAGDADPDHGHLHLGGRAVSVLSVQAALTGLFFMDLIFAKHHLSGPEAGLYGAAGTMARTIPFGIGLISLVASPRAAAAYHISRATLKHLLALTFGTGAACAIIAVILVGFFAGWLLALAFGQQYVSAAQLLRLYAVDGALLALNGLAASYLLAVGNYAIAPYLIAACIVEAAVMALFGTTAPRLLYIAIVVNAALLPLIAWFIVGTLRAAPQAPAEAKA
jgi:O-antigen/teichoic acid export membrane protein